RRAGDARGCTRAGSGASHERVNVERAFTRFIAAFNDLDWITFRGAFARDVSVVNPDIPEAKSMDRIDGRRKVEEGFESVFAATRAVHVHASNVSPHTQSQSRTK